MNLLTDAWLPVRTLSGKRIVIRPSELNEGPDLPVAIEWSRSSFPGAITEFMVGLFQTILFPEDAKAWRDFLEKPPSRSFLEKEFSKAAFAFNLEGDAPFMQDTTLKSMAEDSRKPIQKLLVDGVSDNQEKNRADLFTKSGDISALCKSCAAAAIIDLQAHAPQGGAGYGTSNRGGCPPTTLISCDTIWKTVWANVLEERFFKMSGRGDYREIFPWVGGSKKHPLHVYWGLPRRVFLEEASEGTCSICTGKGAVHRSFLSSPGGIKYAESDWRHPLSPYVRNKEGSWVVRATEGDLVGYRNWMGILVDTPQGDGLPAKVIRRWIDLNIPGEDIRLWAFGYQCDQAAIIRWCEGRMPIVMVPEDKRPAFEKFIRTLVTLAERGREQLQASIFGALKQSLRPTHRTRASLSLWPRTEQAFLEHVRAAAKGDDQEKLKDSFATIIQREAMAIFNEAAGISSPEWVARYAHKLSRILGDRNPMTLKTKKYGDSRLEEEA